NEDRRIEDLAAPDDPKEVHRIVERSGHDEVGEVVTRRIVVVDPEQTAGGGVRRADPTVGGNDDAWQPGVVPPVSGERRAPGTVSIDVPARGAGDRPLADHDAREDPPKG